MDNSKKVEAREGSWQIERQQNLLRKGVKGNALGIGKENREGSEDAVELNVAKEVGQELVPDRSARLTELRRLIEAGQYKPDMNKVARAVSDTIDEEILFGKLMNDK